jgi:hypothetical protein
VAEGGADLVDVARLDDLGDESAVQARVDVVESGRHGWIIPPCAVEF